LDKKKMKAYLIFVFLCLFGTAFCEICSYVSSDAKWYYDLTPLAKTSGTPYSFVAANGDTYYFNFCESLNNMKGISCPKDSAVCLQSGKSLLNLGENDDDDAMWADSPFGVDKGIELTYGDGQTCQDTKYKSLLRLNCSAAEEITVVDASTDSCFTVINVRTKYACPVLNDGKYNDVYYYHHSRPSSVNIFIILGLAFLCCACVLCCIRCCCVRRRCARKCNQGQCVQKNGDYSSIECQTFSETSDQVPVFPLATEQSTSQSVPPYFVMYPPVQPAQGNQQFYVPPMYMMPPQTAPSNPVENKESQIESDEKLARQLQEQLNNE
jgi:hypothetical protein